MDHEDRPRAGSKSLTDPAAAAAVLDRALTEEDRAAGGIALLICDGKGRLLMPVFVEDFPVMASPSLRRQAMDWAAHACRHGVVAPGAVSLVVAVVHGPEPQEAAERDWAATVRCTARREALRVLHVMAVRGRTIVALPATRAAA